MADSIQWTGPNGSTVGIESLKQSIQYWMDTFDEMTYTEGEEERVEALKLKRKALGV